ncbi:MAG: HAMP domain-containing histidine kinase, partial [Clostridiales bacterium]|nr:HAMP domain-containing histidine kinase [Clostridiales bacterium]
MKKQIKGKLLLIALLSMALTLVLSVAVFYGVFEDQVKRNLRQSGALMQAGLERVPDTALLEAYARSGFWVALMDENGDVLFEDGAGAEGAENHLDRPEVEQALRQGHGEAVRPGGAPGRHVYYSAARLSDGRVLWVAREALGIAPFYKQAIPWLAVIVAVLAVLSVRLAALLTKRLVEPIEAMAENIDEIEERVPYAELEPFAVAVKEYHLRRQETERIRQEFTANVSHELKTPLTSISGYAEMIENGMAKPEDVEEFAGKIGLEASRLINLIGDIIQLSEVDDPVAHQGSFTRVDLLAVAQRTMESLKINADMNHITLCATGRHL